MNRRNLISKLLNLAMVPLLIGQRRFGEGREGDPDWLYNSQCRYCGNYQYIHLGSYDGRVVVTEFHVPKCRRENMNGKASWR